MVYYAKTVEVIKKISIVYYTLKFIRNIINQIKGKKMKPTKLSNILDNTADVLSRSYDVFKDGFQFWETLELIGIIKKAISIANEAVDVKVLSYTPEQLKQYTSEFTTDIINIFYDEKQEDTNDEVDLSASLAIVENLSNLVGIGIKAGKDGYTYSDIQYLPEAVAESVGFATSIGEAIQELNKLSREEISIFAGALVSKIVAHLK